MLLAIEVKENSLFTELYSLIKADNHKFTIKIILDISLNPYIKVKAKEKVSNRP